MSNIISWFVDANLAYFDFNPHNHRGTLLFELTFIVKLQITLSRTLSFIYSQFHEPCFRFFFSQIYSIFCVLNLLLLNDNNCKKIFVGNVRVICI